MARVSKLKCSQGFIRLQLLAIAICYLLPLGAREVISFNKQWEFKKGPFSADPILFASSFDQWDSVQTVNFKYGHGILKAYMGLRPTDPDTVEYEALIKKAYGEEKGEEYLARSIHHVLIYPYLSVQSPLQQVRCLRPMAPNKTLSEIWHFRLKGVPEAIYERSLWYFNLVNSPATMINADDLENWTKGQLGLQSKGGEWVSFHRNYGGDTEKDGVLYSNNGTSEVVMRNQFKAWESYIRAAIQPSAKA